MHRLAANDTLNMFTVPPRCVSSSNGNNFVCKCAIKDDSECTTAPRGTTGPVVPKTTGYVCYSSSRKRRAAGTTYAATLMTTTDSDNLVNISEVIASGQ